MKKTDAVYAVQDVCEKYLKVFTTGYASRIAYARGSRQDSFCMVGSMGLASAIGFGMAATSGKPVVVVDGDGGASMGLPSFLLASLFPGASVLHVVLDDGLYESTGAQRVSEAPFDFKSIADACGYVRTCRVETLEDLRRELELSAAGARLVQCLVTPDGSRGARVSQPLSAIARQLIEFNEESA